MLIRECFQMFCLATADYRRERLLSLCSILGLAAVLAPLLVLYGVKFGVVTTMVSRMRSDPLTLELSPVSSGHFTQDFFTSLWQEPGVAFVLPRTRSIAATMQLSNTAGDGTRRTVVCSMEPTAAGDPLLARYGCEAPVMALREGKHGWIALAGSFVLMIYYTTISGWMVDYFVRFLDGSFQGLSTKEVADVFGSMLANPTELLGFMGLNVLIGFAVCAGGVAKSLEKVTKVMMLGLLFLIVILAGNSLLLPGAEEGLRFYLLPDWNRAAAAGLGNVASAAMFQAFFTLSVGQGSMEIFASYMSKDNSLTGEAVRITILDTFVAIMAGLIIFPACFAFGVAPAEGPSLIFVALPNIFINMPMGQLWGGLFFLFMTFASFSTVTAVFESLIGNCMDNFGWSRKKSVLILLPLVFFGSIPCVLGFNVWQDVHLLGARGILDTEDFFVSSLVLPGGSLLFVLFCTTRYGWGFDKYMAEVNMGTGVKMPRWVKPYFKYVLPILIFGILVRGLL